MWLWPWLVACTGGIDPELAAQRSAAERWHEGKASLDAGAPDQARQHFVAAQSHRSDALLIGWEAQAMAEAGDLEGAVARMEDALRLAPPFAQGRYNRAAWLVRLRRPDQAAPELRRAIADGGAQALEVLEDPDFADVLQHPAFSFLPSEALSIAIDRPPPTAFWGTEVVVRLRLRGLVRPPVTVASPDVVGPAILVRASEVWMATSDPEPGVDLEWTLKVVGAGRIELGPFQVQSGLHTGGTASVVVEAQAPPGKTPPSGRPVQLLQPGELAQRVGPDAAANLDGRLVVNGLTIDRVEVTPHMGSPVRLERRALDGHLEVLRLFEGPAEHVRVVRGGEVVFDGPPR